MVNFKDFYTADEYGEQWRWRIKSLRLFPLDLSGNIIESPGIGFDEEISFGITFPPVFNDTDGSRDSHTFLAQHFYCRSTYITEGKL